MGSWATVDDVFTLTGVRTEPDVLAQAQGLLDLFSGVVYGTAADMPVRDRRLLRMATSYQAAFIETNPGLFGRVAVRSMSQDGTSFTINDSQGQADPDALLMAPLTKRCLAGLSWRRTRVVSVRRRPYRPNTLVGTIRRWETDDHPWRPM